MESSWGGKSVDRTLLHLLGLSFVTVASALAQVAPSKLGSIPGAPQEMTDPAYPDPRNPFW